MSRAGFSGYSGASGLPRQSGHNGSSGRAGHPVAPAVTRPATGPSPAALRCLSDRELLARVKVLVSRERATTLEILVHLTEVERRRLHLGLGYPSLFEYCTRHLGYSSSAAGRRIHAARCIRDYPEVHELLEKNELNLIAVSLAASILNKSNAKQLISEIRGKSPREVEAIVATYRPPVSMRDRAKPVCVVVTKLVEKKPVNSGQTGPITPTGGSEISPNIVAAALVGGPPHANTVTQPPPQLSTGAADELVTSPETDELGPTPRTGEEAASPVVPTPRIERKLLLQFLASERFMKKFERAKALLSNKLGKPSYEAVLETALDEFLARHDPENRRRKREEREKKRGANAKPVNGEDKASGQKLTTPPGEPLCDEPARSHREPEPSRRDPRRPHPGTGARQRGPDLSQGDSSPSRHIPAATRDAVFARDKGRCVYVGSTGKRCVATHNLQVDHIVPFARGGTHAIAYLRLLCERHNKREAERAYGVNTMRRFRTSE